MTTTSGPDDRSGNGDQLEPRAVTSPDGDPAPELVSSPDVVSAPGVVTPPEVATSPAAVAAPVSEAVVAVPDTASASDTASAPDTVTARESDPLRDADAASKAAAGSDAAAAPDGVGTRALRFLDERRYLCLSAVLVVLMVLYTLRREWAMGVDIWEHSAAVREFALHPLHPRHPFYDVSSPHQFFNPYALILGLVSRFTGMSATTVLDLAGIGNLVLVLVGLRLFTARITRRRHVDFYALLFILFLWGPGAWYFSGFLHWNVLAIDLDYPATFAKGISLIALWLYLRFLEERQPRLLVITIALLTLTLLCHPVDAVAAYVGLVAVSFLHKDQRGDQNVALAVGVAGASFILAFLWPYFSFADLVFGKEQASYRTSIAGADHDMYVKVIARTFPMLIVVPFYLRRVWRDWRDPLALYLSGLIAAYLYGFWTHNWSYGRLISSIMFIAAILLADELVASSEGTVAAGEAGRPTLRWIAVTTVGLLALGMFNVRDGFANLPRVISKRLPYNWAHSSVDLAKLSQFSFLEQMTERSDMVLADVYTSMSVPTFSGRTIAIARTQAFVSADQRGADLGTFFDPQTPESTRRSILEKYSVDYVLLVQSLLASEPATYQPIREMGPNIYTNERFVLVDVRGGSTGNGSTGGG